MEPVLAAAVALEKFLGDPCDAESRWSYRQMLAVDEAEVFPQAIVDALHSWGLSEFYIPAAALGGRFDRIDEMLYVLRSVARRDIAVSIAHAKTFLGSAAVWVGGSPSIQQRCAAVIRSGQAVSLGLTERDHGGDLGNNECHLTQDSVGVWRLDGEKWLINNATRCAALTIYANLGDSRGATAGSLLWVEKERIGSQAYAALPKIRTTGVRGADISGICFTGAVLGEGDIVGKQGHGLKTTLLSLQLSRTLCSGLSTGAGDQAVRTLAIFARRRVLYAKRLIEHEFGRGRLANVFLLQLIAECVAFGAARSVHTQPRAMSVVSSLAKYLVPELVDEVFDQCEQGLGARAYLRVEPWTHFQKAKRDHKLVGLFDGSTVVNLQSIAVQLPRVMFRTLCEFPGEAERLAVRDRLQKTFDLSAELPALDLSALTLLSTGPSAEMQFICSGMGHEALGSLTPGMVSRLQKFREAILAFGTYVQETLSRAPATAPEQFDAAQKFASLHAAATCFLVWYFNRGSSVSPWDPSFLEGTWVEHVLDYMLSGKTNSLLGDDLLPWLERLVAQQQALSFLPFASPHASTLDVQSLATCLEHS